MSSHTPVKSLISLVDSLKVVSYEIFFYSVLPFLYLLCPVCGLYFASQEDEDETRATICSECIRKQVLRDNERLPKMILLYSRKKKDGSHSLLPR